MDEEELGLTEKKETRNQMVQRHKREFTKLKKSSLPKKELAQKEKELKERHAKELVELEQKTEEETNKDEEAEEEETDLNQNTKKPSRQQRRKEAKINAEKERRKKLESERPAAGPDKKSLERQSLRQILHPLGLDFKEIKPDGDCLFTAVVHQLELNGRSKEYTAASLRQATAQYMLDKKEDFMPFIEVDNENEYKKYCENIRTTHEWGGQPEAQAITHVIKTKMIVYSADAPILEMGEEYSSLPKSPAAVRLSYHRHEYTLGEHYNSVIPYTPKPPEDEDDEFK
eukprot:TRINITY_DN4893_c0_g1_i1.p2 TRINITY_DN4893_c0_g1~~TRINITY_DN4893_c0_g1_i1.p2  ORF type:complete len:299 (+),score=68.71 TRINITY_DN4893_c0_g1_i1:41-898(+)